MHISMHTIFSWHYQGLLYISFEWTNCPTLYSPFTIDPRIMKLHIVELNVNQKKPGTYVVYKQWNAYTHKQGPKQRTVPPKFK